MPDVLRIGLLPPELEPARDLYRRGRVGQALAVVEQYLGKHPDVAAALGLAAICLGELGRFDDAERAATAALRQEKNQAWLYEAWAAAMAGKKAWLRAVAGQKRAVALAPAETELQAALGYYLCQAGQASDAAAVCRQVLAQRPGQPLAVAALVRVLERQGDLAGAAAVIQRALTADPESVAVLAEHGLHHLRLGRAQAALAALAGALQRDPAHPDAQDGFVAALAQVNPGRASWVRRLLGYARWPGMARWGLLFGVYVGFRILQILVRLWPGVRPALTVFVFASLAFALVVWSAEPLLSLLWRRGWLAGSGHTTGDQV